jgi:hypothetical protein
LVFGIFLLAQHRDNGRGDATLFEAKAMHFDMDHPQHMAVFTRQTWGCEELLLYGQAWLGEDQ